jgi:alkanesulfonate monooxygenase SsuD/methylene tetrahydromethanopterin reductase-like flavin-dependent oxidoreductase (luciferase family)
MNCIFFHLMPYADLDLDFDQRYPTSWVTLPNSYYDPVKGHRLYNRYLDELEFADQLGFDGICVNEHHQTAYGLMAAPNVLAGALSRRTRNARIYVLGRALPLVNNPLAIAEEFAILDNVTAGRLVVGFVRGIGAEYHSQAVSPAESHDRYYEAHDLIIRAWTEIGPFPFEGKYYRIPYANIWPRPFQKPHPPVWIPSQGSTETIVWAAARERKYTYLQTISPISAVSRYMKMYRDEAEKAGYESSPEQLGWATPIFVGETDASAYRDAKVHLENFFNKFLRMPMEMLLPPGYVSIRSAFGVMQAKASIAGGSTTIDDMMKNGTCIIGSTRNGS